PEALSGATLVVIDVLRATTTITAALAAGAKEVIPCFEIDEARRIAAELPPGTSVLGGERGGKRIDGFDLGNSPTEYTPERVAGKSVVITTTNGTKALRQCRLAAEVWLGSLTNLGSVVARISAKPTIHVVCAGTDGHITLEDVVTAGYFVLALNRLGDWTEGDSAILARVAAESCENDSARLRSNFTQSRGGHNLVELGYDADIDYAMRLDINSVAPRLELKEWRIRSA
ncbi:MAG: 2-phosphosulfolactate phosphatase, partial [Planctomycetia bacterium]|nr:2-phosphosulfolactate phosphatase [Planctomycetia bacterium]